MNLTEQGKKDSVEFLNLLKEQCERRGVFLCDMKDLQKGRAEPDVLKGLAAGLIGGLYCFVDDEPIPGCMDQSNRRI